MKFGPVGAELFVVDRRIYRWMVREACRS